MTVFKNLSSRQISFAILKGKIYFRILVRADFHECKVGDEIIVSFDNLKADERLQQEWHCKVYDIKQSKKPFSKYLYAKEL